MYVWMPLLTCMEAGAVILNAPQESSSLFVCLIALFCEMESLTGLELTYWLRLATSEP